MEGLLRASLRAGPAYRAEAVALAAEFALQTVDWIAGSEQCPTVVMAWWRVLSTALLHPDDLQGFCRAWKNSSVWRIVRIAENQIQRQQLLPDASTANATAAAVAARLLLLWPECPLKEAAASLQQLMGAIDYEARQAVVEACEAHLNRAALHAELPAVLLAAAQSESHQATQSAMLCLVANLWCRAGIQGDHQRAVKAVAQLQVQFRAEVSKICSGQLAALRCVAVWLSRHVDDPRFAGHCWHFVLCQMTTLKGSISQLAVAETLVFVLEQVGPQLLERELQGLPMDTAVEIFEVCLRLSQHEDTGISNGMSALLSPIYERHEAHLQQQTSAGNGTHFKAPGFSCRRLTREAVLLRLLVLAWSAGCKFGCPLKMMATLSLQLLPQAMMTGWPGRAAATAAATAPSIFEETEDLPHLELPLLAQTLAMVVVQSPASGSSETVLRWDVGDTVVSAWQSLESPQREPVAVVAMATIMRACVLRMGKEAEKPSSLTVLHQQLQNMSRDAAWQPCSDLLSANETELERHWAQWRLRSM